MSKYYLTTLLSPREVKLNFRKKTENKFQYGGQYMRIVVWYSAIYDGNPGFPSIYEAIQATPHSTYFIKKKNWGFPGGTVVGNLPANAGDTGSSPGLGRSHMPRSN